MTQGLEPPLPRAVARSPSGTNTHGTAILPGGKLPSRSPSHLFGPDARDGTLTTPVLQILERTSATLEHLDLQRMNRNADYTDISPSLPEPTDRSIAAASSSAGILTSCCGATVTTPGCASSIAMARTGARLERQKNSPRVQKSKQWAAASARMSPERKLEKYLQVHCGDHGDRSSRWAVGASKDPPTASTAVACSTLGIEDEASQVPARTRLSPHGHGHLGKIPSGLCNGTAVAVLTVESLEALKAARVERNAAVGRIRPRPATVLEKEAPNAELSPQWPDPAELQQEFDARLGKAQQDFAEACANAQVWWLQLWRQAIRWYWHDD